MQLTVEVLLKWVEHEWCKWKMVEFEKAYLTISSAYRGETGGTGEW